MAARALRLLLLPLWGLIAATPAGSLSDATLRALAGSDAIACGTAKDRQSADRVWQCAADALSRGAPFFCRYAPPTGDVTDLSPARVGGVWAFPAGYYADRARIVRAVWLESGVVKTTIVLHPTDPRRPIRLMAGIRPPRLARPSSVHTAHPTLNATAVFEAVITARGTVADLRPLKPLPGALNPEAERLVRNCPFTPASFFGVPVPVIYNVTVRVRAGVMGVGDGAGDAAAPRK